jgi:hypothetical protein
MARLAKGAGVLALFAGGAMLWSAAGDERPERTGAAATAIAVGGTMQPQHATRPIPPPETATEPPKPAPALAQVAVRDKAMPRDELVRSIKRELARVGCYAGPLDADWGEAAVTGVKAFSHHLGLPIKDEAPHHVLLTLLEGYRGAACRLTCPTGLIAGSDGVCRSTTTTASAPSPSSATSERPMSAPAKSAPPPAVAAALPAPSTTPATTQPELPAAGVALPPPIIPPPSIPNATVPPAASIKAARVDRKPSPSVEQRQVKAAPKAETRQERTVPRRKVAKRVDRARPDDAVRKSDGFQPRTTRSPFSQGRDPYDVAANGAIDRPPAVVRPEGVTAR